MTLQTKLVAAWGFVWTVLYFLIASDHEPIGYIGLGFMIPAFVVFFAYVPGLWATAFIAGGLMMLSNPAAGGALLLAALFCKWVQDLDNEPKP